MELAVWYAPPRSRPEKFGDPFHDAITSQALYNEKQILIGGTMRGTMLKGDMLKSSKLTVTHSIRPGKLLAIDLSTGELLRLLAAHKHTCTQRH